MMAGDWSDSHLGARIRVDCYEGYRSQETPRRLVIAGRAVDVGEVLDRWADTDHRYFRVTGDDGRAYLVRYDEREGEWTLVSGMRLEGPARSASDP